MSIGRSQILALYGQTQVLVVEDDDVNAQVALTMLKRLGCRADVAVNGVEAIEFFQRESYDLLLMAWRMPLMDGLEATARIRSLPRGLSCPIVGTSAGMGRMECIAAGMNDLMPKPFRLENLKAVLSKWTLWDEAHQAGAGH